MRFGSGTEVTETLFDVCFAVISGSRETPMALPLCAISGSRDAGGAPQRRAK